MSRTSIPTPTLRRRPTLTDAPQTVRVLGIDPGSRLTGFGIIDVAGQRTSYVGSGVIRLGGGELPARLGRIFADLSEIISEYHINEAAVEQVFMHRNADSALKLGQARGAAICAIMQHHLPLAEYAPRSIKQALVGKGGANKDQVSFMVRSLLKLNAAPQEDAGDALAVALCHFHHRQHQRLLQQKGKPA